MMAERGSNPSPEDAPSARHTPVMLAEVLQALQPKPGDIIIDGTFGAGGYTGAILQTGANVVAIDRDPQAIAGGAEMRRKYSDRLDLVEGRFSQLDRHCIASGHDRADGVALDVGVSSMQIDQADRGFSFQKSGPLDMRMGGVGPTAADLVNTAKRSDLTRIIGILGEERKAGRISSAIEKRRESAAFQDTLDLAHFIEATIGKHPKDKIHPATRTFQALRIYINRELEELAEALCAAERILKPGGRLVVVSFHSLEDRLVKRFLTDRATRAGGSRHAPQVSNKELTFELITKGTTAASEAESSFNPRARSAKLRAARRVQAEPRGADHSIFGLPDFSNVHLIEASGEEAK